MLNLTENSRKLSFLLWIRGSICYNIGIIDNKWYCYDYSGAWSFELRNGFENDTRFPGIHASKTKVSTKHLMSLLTSEWLDNHSSSRC